MTCLPVLSIRAGFETTEKIDFTTERNSITYRKLLFAVLVASDEDSSTGTPGNYFSIRSAKERS